MAANVGGVCCIPEVAKIESQPSLRERTRDAVREQIRERALALFIEQGFDQTTVDDIAQSAGISARSFFRYFATKEEVVTGNLAEVGSLIRDALAARPASERPFAAMRAAMAPLTAMIEADPTRGLRAMRISTSTPSLRAHSLEKHLTWATMLVPIIERRLGGTKQSRSLRAQTIVQTSLACLDVALSEWAERDGRTPLSTLLDEAFAELA